MSGLAGCQITLTNESFVTALYLADSGGQMWRSLDGGTIWGPVTAPVTGLVSALSFATPMLGVAACDASGVYRTADAGMTWAQVIAGTYNGVVMLDAANGWACGDGALFKRTQDGGLTWADVVTDDVDVTNLNCVAMTTDATGQMVGTCVGAVYSGAAVILNGVVTTSNVETWTLASSGAPAAELFSCDVWCGSPSPGLYRLAAGGAVYYSSNSGADWTSSGVAGTGPTMSTAVTTPARRLMGPRHAIMGITSLGYSVNSGAAFVYDGTFYGALEGLPYLRTDPAHVWAISDSTFWASRDGGARWSVCTIPSSGALKSASAAATGYLQTGPALTLEVRS